MTEEIKEKIKEKIFPRSRDVIKDYEKFPWDRTWKRNSSQAIAIGIWGCIALSPYKDEIINSIFNECEENWEIEFEFRDRDNILNEGYNPKNSYDARTRIDVKLYCRDKVKLIESKFNEYGDDVCSSTKEKENNNGSKYIECHENYEFEDYWISANKKVECRCAFQGKGIKYWEYIPKIYDFENVFDQDGNLIPCPFKNQYQIMRQLCLGMAIEEDQKIEVKNYLMYVNSDKSHICKKIQSTNYAEELSKYLKDKNRLSIMHYNGILNDDKKGIIDIAKKVVENDKEELKVFKDLEEWIKGKIDNLSENDANKAQNL